MISVAAELVGMHPQTLRMYENRGLVQPSRTPGGTRLYSDRNLERLRLIQRLTTELGLNLAGVEHVLRLEDEMRALHRASRPPQELPPGDRRLPAATPINAEDLIAAIATRFVALRHKVAVTA